jgi:hypothetical protein
LFKYCKYEGVVQVVGIILQIKNYIKLFTLIFFNLTCLRQ